MPTPVQQTSRCKSCGALIIWAKTEAGKAMPLDAKPMAGMFEIVADAKFELAGGPHCRSRRDVYQSHFATCPQAAQHRKAGG